MSWFSSIFGDNSNADPHNTGLPDLNEPYVDDSNQDSAYESHPTYVGDHGYGSHPMYGTDHGYESHQTYGTNPGYESHHTYGTDYGYESHHAYGTDYGYESHHTYGTDYGYESHHAYGTDYGYENLSVQENDPVYDNRLVQENQYSFVQESNIVYESDKEREDHPDISFQPEHELRSRDEMVEWASERALRHGYVLTTRRSKKNLNKTMVVQVWLGCDRGGEPKNKATNRRTQSKRCGCPFLLYGEYNPATGCWDVQVQNSEHNHPPAQHLEGHAHARRKSISEADRVMIEQLHKQNMEPRFIYAAIRRQNSKSLLVLKDVQNAVAKLSREMKVGQTSMQELEHVLFSRQYIYHTRVNPATNAVEEVFFVHPRSHVMWRAFPHVLMMDATYNTNVYKMPLMQVVGVTSTGESFNVAHAFISAEREDNFLWMLEHLKDMLHNCMEPRVILTDRDQALMNACAKTFPNATHSLCRWHIYNNILKRCRQGVPQKVWDSFRGLWTTVCESPTPELFEFNRNKIYELFTGCGKNDAFHYIDENWFGRDKERFVTAWTNKYLHFDQRTTNRVESQHAALKRYLRGANSKLDRIVDFVDQIVDSQDARIKQSFENSIIKIGKHHGHPLFRNLHGKVSHKALDLLEVELYKMASMQQHHGSCGCQLAISCGLPCACMLEKYENTGRPIPLCAVDVFWRKLDFEPASVGPPEVDVDREMNLIKQHIMSQPPAVKRSILSKIKTVIYPHKSDKKPPVVKQETRGRPTIKQTEQRKADAVRKSDTSYDASQQSRFNAGRHSSYVSSQDLERPLSFDTGKKPVMQRSRSAALKKSQPGDAHGFPLIVDDESLNNLKRYKSEIPQMFHMYIDRIIDVKPDGNCGFRATAVGMGMETKNWFFIREECLAELDNNMDVWKLIFDKEADGQYDRVRSSIEWKLVSPAPKEKWMWMPYAGLLIANRFHQVVHCLSNQGNTTFFPLLLGPNQVNEPHRFVTLVHVNGCHFISVKLTGDYPMPFPDYFWSAYRSEAAAEWLVMYRSRMPDKPETQQSEYVNLLSSSNKDTSSYDLYKKLL